MEEFPSGFGYIVGGPYNYNALRINKLAIDHSNQFNRFKDNKADFCDRQMERVLEHCLKTGKKIRQVAFLPKTLKRFATCLAPQQLLFAI
jgi:hypothetical protein